MFFTILIIRGYYEYKYYDHDWDDNLTMYVSIHYIL